MAVSQSLAVTQSSQNVSGNTSQVRIVWKSTQSGASYNNYTATAYYYISVNGGAETRYSVSYTLPKGTTKTILDKTITVAHKADGTGTVKVRTWMDTGISAGTVTQSKTLTLTTIPRATTPTLSASSVYMGAAVTINTPRASSSFTHDLYCIDPNGTSTTIATKVATSYSWTVPDFASLVPNGTSCTLTVQCITYNGTTKIGSKTVKLTAKVPTTDVPTISKVSITEAVEGYADQYGAFIQGKSKLKVSITAAGAGGSTIKSYRTTIGGKAYSGQSFTSGYLYTAGTMAVVTTVTDSRGRTASKTTNITVLAYSVPAIEELSVQRVNGSGTPTPDGVYAELAFRFRRPLLNGGNLLGATFEFKQSAASTWTTIQSGTAGGDANGVTDSQILVDEFVFSLSYSYQFRVTLRDSFGAQAYTTVILPSGKFILDIGADGNSLAVGKTAEHANTFESAWELRGSFGEVPNHALVIPSAADLDDYLTPGFYRFSEANYSTIANMPIGGKASGLVRVESEGEKNQVRQICTRCADAKREIWERLYFSNTWHDWAPIYKGGTGRILWEGGYYMTAGHTVTLSELVSAQPNGIVLVFGLYGTNVRDGCICSFFVPKQVVAATPGNAHSFMLSGLGDFSIMAAKCLHIYDDKITGRAENGASGTGNSGVQYNNNAYILKYVIGV